MAKRKGSREPATGLKKPMRSMKEPSRRERESVTTMSKKGRPLAPRRESLITTIEKIPAQEGKHETAQNKKKQRFLNIQSTGGLHAKQATCCNDLHKLHNEKNPKEALI
jgi:hypothetical protein